jgi:hypothetical protein
LVVSIGRPGHESAIVAESTRHLQKQSGAAYIWRSDERDRNIGALQLATLARDRHGKDPTRIELFDMVWWRYFRDCEPPPGRRAAVGTSGT